MKLISKYLFSIIFWSCISVMQSQENQPKDTVPIAKKGDRYGIRIGADLFKLTRSFYDTNYKGLELVGDYRLTKKYYLAGELGNENKTVQEDNLNFTTKGSYLRIGFDYNLHQNWLDLENMIYIGMRYGIATFSQDLNSYKIYNSSSYFGQSQTITEATTYNGLNAQWAEVIVGLKTKVFNNIFVGFSLRGNRLLSNKKPDGFDNLYIPGFHRTYNGDFGVGLNYTVSYLLPLYKKKLATKPEKNKKPKK